MYRIKMFNVTKVTHVKVNTLFDMFLLNNLLKKNKRILTINRWIMKWLRIDGYPLDRIRTHYKRNNIFLWQIDNHWYIAWSNNIPGCDKGVCIDNFYTCAGRSHTGNNIGLVVSRFYHHYCCRCYRCYPCSASLRTCHQRFASLRISHHRSCRHYHWNFLLQSWYRVKQHRLPAT